MDSDLEIVETLVDQATKVVERLYVPNRHQIAAVIRDRDGRVHVGIHIEAMVGRASTCAEAGALCNAVLEQADLRGGIVVAVRYPRPSDLSETIKVVSPCGLCRELLLDYSADMRAVVDVGNGLALAALRELLPHKYVGTKWN